MATDWVPVVFGGIAGGFVGAFGAVLAGVLTIRGQYSLERKLASEERRKAAASRLTGEMSALRTELILLDEMATVGDLAASAVDISKRWPGWFSLATSVSWGAVVEVQAIEEGDFGEGFLEMDDDEKIKLLRGRFGRQRLRAEKLMQICIGISAEIQGSEVHNVTNEHWALRSPIYKRKHRAAPGEE